MSRFGLVIPSELDAPFARDTIDQLVLVYAYSAVMYFVIAATSIVVYFGLEFVLSRACCYGKPVEEYPLDQQICKETFESFEQFERFENVENIDSQEYEKSMKRLRVVRAMFALVALLGVVFVLINSVASIIMTTQTIRNVDTITQKMRNINERLGQLTSLKQSEISSTLNMFNTLNTLNTITNLPDTQKNIIANLLTDVQALNQSLQQFGNPPNMINMIPLYSVISTVEPFHRTSTFYALTIFWFVVLGMLLTLIRCSARCNNENDTSQNGCVCEKMCCFWTTVKIVVIVSMIFASVHTALGLALNAFMCDYCQSPETWSKAIFGMGYPQFNSTQPQRVLNFYLDCFSNVSNVSNPLLGTFVESFTITNRFTLQLDELLFFANTQRPVMIQPVEIAIRANKAVTSNGQTLISAFNNCIATNTDLTRIFDEICDSYRVWTFWTLLAIFVSVYVLVTVRPMWNILRVYRAHEARVYRYFEQIKRLSVSRHTT